MVPTLILLHGWGFDAGLWDGLAQALSNHPIARWDRGYFGERAASAVEGPVVGIGHSLGSMLLAEQLPPEAPLIAINGFDRFVGDGAVAPRVLERMRSRFAEDPAEVLGEFRERCGAAAPPEELDESRLGIDLALLGSRRTAAAPLRTLSLQGGQDPILPESLRERVFPGAERATLSDAGHLLPVSHPAWCAERIEAFLCR